MDRRCDAVIVGAGPAGSTAAILLAKAGWDIVVLEKATFPRRKACGEYISGAAWPLLEELDVAGRIAAKAGPEILRVGLFAGNDVIDAPMPKAASFRSGRALGRESLDTLLLEEAVRRGAVAIEGGACTSIRRDGEDFACIYSFLGDERTIHARVVLGAHGAWESGALPTQSKHVAARQYDLLGFKAHFLRANLPPDLMPLVLFPGGYGGMVTTDAARVSLSCCVRRDTLARLRAHRRGLRAGDALLSHICEGNRGVRRALGGASIDGAWLSAAPIRPAIRRFRAAGMFALGNAAGEAHPIIAEGISMAIQSSFLLCERLAAAGRAATDATLEAIGHDYEAAWRRNFAARVRAAAIFAALATRSATRSLSVQALRAAPALLTLGAHWSGKDQALRRVMAAGALA
jgi:flavin-dependent dehydrogenase